ncbi:exonuclease SbcD [Aequitasia blattaphilus]|uniref:Nuclease SbcCD subunit D n=1 Tax=Aequitasia blattaphilus TaxID=2949332 RepID=A0ABT1E6J9_9FIRM|nr:exonuclease SbcCD subunit D [Aequitasia blattaphilus]MCP1101461.1 exonuclease SbcCD subunit D [Aequitasia blattaphilus]MCR8614101.1 exonuclease SbcCD subunit D [Aequitasia blattaphilus]
MRFFHLSDLHIGKVLHHYSLKEDQVHVLNQVIEYAKELKPDGIVIAGDIYDKSVPSAEAVSVFDEFITGLAQITPAIPLLIIGGNHDSGERLDYGAQIMRHQNIFIMGTATDTEGMRKVTLSDEEGEVDFYMLPFFKPSYVRNLLGEEKSLSYSDTLQELIGRENIDFLNRRNVLIAHQFFVRGEFVPERSESEVFSVGGLDRIESSLVENFDYVALGHIHKEQEIGEEKIRYCGTLLKYSLSEYKDKKEMLVVEIHQKSAGVLLQHLPIYPLREVRRKKGNLEEILAEALPEEKKDFVGITLTDEGELYQAKERLFSVYENILEIKIDNQRTRKKIESFEEESQSQNPFESFEEFFEEIHGRGLLPEEMEKMKYIFEAVEEGK